MPLETGLEDGVAATLSLHAAAPPQKAVNVGARIGCVGSTRIAGNAGALDSALVTIAFEVEAMARLLARTTLRRGCWVCDLAADSKGYVRIRIGDRKVMAHRLAYQVFCGPIAVGMTIDHLCRNTGCFNPAHLEQVTNAENIRRGSQGRWQMAKTHCRRGHAYTPENTYRPPGKNERWCRECQRINGRRNDAKRRQSGSTQ